jgi:hypothetical protein
MLKSIILYDVFREPVSNISGLKLGDAATHNNMNIMNTFYQHKIYIPTHGQLTVPKHLQTILLKTGKLPEVFLDMRVYRGREIGSDHFLTLDKLNFLPT